MIYKKIKDFPLYVIDENYNVFRISGKKQVIPNGFIYRLKKQFISLDSNNLAIKTSIYLPITMTQLMAEYETYPIYDKFSKRVSFE